MGLKVNKTYSFPDIKNNFISEALSQLTMAIRHPNALQPDNVMAYDNAVSALGKICQFHRNSIDSTQVYTLGNLLFLYIFNLGYAWGEYSNFGCIYQIF